MPSLSSGLRIILGIVAAVAGVLASLIGNILAVNILYFITRRGRKPTERPLFVWVIFFITVFVSVVLGSIAAFSITKQENVANPNEIKPISQITSQGKTIPSESPIIPTAIPVTSTPELTYFYFDQPKLEKPFVYMDLDTPPEIKNGYLYFDYKAGEKYGERSIFVDLNNRQVLVISTSIAVDQASPNSFSFIQAHAVINNQVLYANFGVRDSGEIFISTVIDHNTIGNNIQTWPGKPLGEFNDLRIDYAPRSMDFYANDEKIYSIESIGTGSFYLSIHVSGDKSGYIKSRWDMITWVPIL